MIGLKLWQDLIADLFEKLARAPRAVLEVKNDEIDPGPPKPIDESQNDFDLSPWYASMGKKTPSVRRPGANIRRKPGASLTHAFLFTFNMIHLPSPDN